MQQHSTFKQMRNEVDKLESRVVTKFPRLGKKGCIAIFVTIAIVIFLLGLVIGYVGHRGKKSTSPGEIPSPITNITRINNTRSCPPLQAEYLLNPLEEGQSFEGMTVKLFCKGRNIAFPTSIECRKKDANNDQSPMEWSHLPVCYPKWLYSDQAQAVTPYARSVNCTGDSTSTQCELECDYDYVPVEKSPYECTNMPCPRWTLKQSRCYTCNKKCDDMHKFQDPKPMDLVKHLGCKCERIIVSSKGNAAISQSSRMGLFSFHGEFRNRPVYKNKVTEDYLVYTEKGTQWFVGPSKYSYSEAGIQVNGMDNYQCPEDLGGKNISKLFMDSSEGSESGTGNWTTDDTLSFDCMKDTYKPVSCGCLKYKVSYEDDKDIPKGLSYMLGEYELGDGHILGLLAPMFINKEKDIHLYSHHPKGLVWNVDTKYKESLPFLRGIQNMTDVKRACPENENLMWEWLNSTAYVQDDNIHLKCTHLSK